MSSKIHNPSEILRMNQILKRTLLAVEKLGISRAQFSKKLGRSVTWFYGALASETDLKVSDLARMETIFGINPRYIMFGEGDILLNKIEDMEGKE